MSRFDRSIVSLAVVFALVLAVCGCQQKVAEKPPVSGPQAGMPQGGPGGFGPPSPLRNAMMQMFGRSPQALKNALDEQIKSGSPAWDTVQPQTAELVKLTGQIAKADPPKGEKDSWAKLAGALESSAKDLDKAAQAKDQKAAAAAMDKISQSCKECHDAHKAGPGGFGGPGGPGGFGPPGGGFGKFGPPGKGPAGPGKTP